MSRDSVRQLIWLGVSGASAVAAHQLARRSLDQAWARTVGEQPPNRGELRDHLPQALLWAGTSGIIVAAARVLGRFAAEAAWRRRTGDDPPVG